VAVGGLLQQELGPSGVGQVARRQQPQGAERGDADRELHVHRRRRSPAGRHQRPGRSRRPEGAEAFGHRHAHAVAPLGGEDIRKDMGALPGMHRQHDVIGPVDAGLGHG
jgi:hypothetical protein